MRNVMRPLAGLFARSQARPNAGDRKTTSRWCRWLMRSLVFLLFFCASSFAQLYEATRCVYHEGDDMRWAQPDYDDSGWAKVATVSRAS